MTDASKFFGGYDLLDPVGMQNVLPVFLAYDRGRLVSLHECPYLFCHCY